MTHFEIFMAGLAILAVFAALIFWGSMIVHCYRNHELSTENRWLWLAVLVFGKLLGAGAYYLTRFRARGSMPVA